MFLHEVSRYKGISYWRSFEDFGVDVAIEHVLS
jgi:hypothetical protein